LGAARGGDGLAAGSESPMILARSELSSLL
jgi:hypothetical protein